MTDREEITPGDLRDLAERFQVWDRLSRELPTPLLRHQARSRAIRLGTELSMGTTALVFRLRGESAS